MAGDQLINFFVCNGADDRGRSLSQILVKSDEWLDITHDYIQWLFPLSEKSGANPNAPLIDVNLASLFGFNETARSNILLGLDRMLSFYGLQRNEKTISKGENWHLRKEIWFVTPTHNDLRITRMLKSMSILGFGDYAQAFLEALLKLSNEPDCGFSSDAIAYWKSAVTTKWNPEQEDYSEAQAAYFVASREVSQKNIQSLWEMVCRFSEVKDASENEIFRWGQVRFKTAIVARTSGVMSRDAFNEECDRHAALLAAAMGGTAYRIQQH